MAEPSDLQGTIERIVYSNERNGWTVARLRIGGSNEPVTVVGNLVSPSPGDSLQMTGTWTHHPKFGRQFEISRYRTVLPVTTEGIEKYLSSGILKGIGPAMAGRIVRRFGEQTLRVIDEDPGRLAEVEGIGEARIEAIRGEWEAQKGNREVIVFLRSHGIGAALAVKLYRQYGNQAIDVVRTNPYRLAAEVFGVGFVKADEIACGLGFARDCPARVGAALSYILGQLAEEGHVYSPRTVLVQRCQEFLEIDRKVIASALEDLGREGKLVVEQPPGGPERDRAVFLPYLHVSETRLAARLLDLLRSPRSLGAIDPSKGLERVRAELGITLAEKQRLAVESALTSKIMTITGGPGTGKTTIVRVLFTIARSSGARVLVCAPTGRAARRIAEAAGCEARTIHRLLEYSPRESRFKKDARDPLPCDLLIADEASMIDTVLARHLLEALPPGASLVLIGDVNQLPSVGPGNVLGDIVASGAVAAVELTEIFRQARRSQIIVNAHRVNVGLVPVEENVGLDDRMSDFHFVEQDDPERAVSTILEIVTQWIPARLRLDPVEDVQVIAPTHKGVAGVENLNRVLQGALNPAPDGFARGDRLLKPGDKVLQVKNDYEKDVFNGDIGRVSRVDRENGLVAVTFEGREIAYDFADLDEIALAYAISVHKAQGSEYPAVVMPILAQHGHLLQRNLLYTALTRGKRLVVVVGTRHALSLAAKNDKQQKRSTLLRDRLRDFGGTNPPDPSRPSLP